MAIDGRSVVRYSDVLKGTDGNHNQSVRFDQHNGFIGITQYETNSEVVNDRVLLTPTQAKALIAFVKSHGKATK